MRNLLRIWLTSGLVIGVGCGEQAQVREYVVPGEQQRVVTTEAIRGQFRAIPFRWKVPAEWRPASNDQFSVVAWAAGPREESAAARITLSELPGTAGIAAQIARWRGQISLPAVSEDEALRDARALEASVSGASWVELMGGEETILGLLIPHEQSLWVFKYRSPNTTADQSGESFRDFCEKIRLEQPAKG